MKKQTILMSLPMLAMMLSACNSNSHVHSFSEEWAHDAENHWHECTAGDGARDGEAPHEWGEGKVTAEPTCTEAGVRTYTCLCGATKTEDISPLGHSAADEWQTDSNYHWHNCTNDGCYEELDKAEHDFVEDESKRVEATCTTKGKKFLKCSVCDYEKEEEIPLAEHSWDEGTVTTPATCEGDGVMTYTCLVCSRTREETLPATGHSWESKSSTEVYQYSEAGSWEECSVCHAKRNETVTTSSPWAAFDFEGENNVICQDTDSTVWNAETHTLTTSKYLHQDGVKFNLAGIVGTERLVVDVTTTVTGATSWGPQGSFFFFDANGDELGSVFCLGKKPLFDAKNLHYNVTALVDGTEVKELPEIGSEFTYRFDFRGFGVVPTSFIICGANGQEATPDIISIKSIVAKETICGHKATELVAGEEVESTCSKAGYTSYVCGHEGCGSAEYKVNKELKDHTPTTVTGAEVATCYQFGGTMTVCSECGEVLDDSQATPAPWVHARGLDDADNFSVQRGESSYDAATQTWITSSYDNLYFNSSTGAAFTETATRKIVSATFTMSFVNGATGWGNYAADLYFGVNGKTCRLYDNNVLGGSQSWENNTGVLAVVDAETGEDLTGKSIYNKKVTVDFDASDVDSITLVTFGTSLANLKLVIDDITFKASVCAHNNTVEFSNGLNCGVRCTDCGRLVTSYVDSFVASTPSGKDSYLTYENGVSFEGKDNCLKSTITAYTQNSDMGWAVNYKLSYKGLVKNARAAGRTLIKVNYYVSASAYDNFRFGWGVGSASNSNVSAAGADHYNSASTLLNGTNIVPNNSSITTEDGTSSKSPANQWLVLTLDVSSDDFADMTDFYIVAPFDCSSSKDRYPIDTYIASVSCVAPTVA